MDRQTIGRRLREVRERKGLSGEALAESMKVHKSEVSRLENGKRGHLDFEKLEAWAAALDVRAELVMWEDGDLEEHAAGLAELLPEVTPEAVAVARDVVALWSDLSGDNRKTLIGLLGQWRRALNAKGE